VIFENGKFITLDAARPEGEAVVARGGRILSVGSREEIARYRGEQTELSPRYNFLSWEAERLPPVSVSTPVHEEQRLDGLRVLPGFIERVGLPRRW
jgi:hypothetical protein